MAQVKSSSLETVNYRLDKIEEVLKTLTDLMLKVSKQENAIVATNNKIDALGDKLEQHIKTEFQAMSEVQGRLEEVEELPIKKKAGMVNYILEYVFKGFVVFAIGAIIFMVKQKI